MFPTVLIMNLKHVVVGNLVSGWLDWDSGSRVPTLTLYCLQEVAFWTMAL